MKVKDIPNCSEMQFISDSQEVELIKHDLDIEEKEFNSFFVLVENGDYSEVYGMFGIIPYTDNTVYKVR